ncbi:MAG: hypothetical protein HY681_12280 [Chloroflexi bacterium]|nr:hypothetical protein [Chloroflexota bacterium]
MNFKTLLTGLTGAGRPVWTRPWTHALALLGGALIVYYLFLAFQYWQASSKVGTLDARRASLALALRGPAPQEAALAEEIARQEQKLARAGKAFTYPSQDSLLALALEASRDVGVALLAVQISEPSPLVQENVQYQTMTMTLTVSGSTRDVLDFLSTFSEKAPVSSVSDLRISGLESVPVAQVKYFVYLSPQPPPKKKGPVNAAATPVSK